MDIVLPEPDIYLLLYQEQANESDKFVFVCEQRIQRLILYTDLEHRHNSAPACV